MGCKRGPPRCDAPPRAPRRSPGRAGSCRPPRKQNDAAEQYRSSSSGSAEIAGYRRRKKQARGRAGRARAGLHNRGGSPLPADHRARNRTARSDRRPPPSMMRAATRPRCSAGCPVRTRRDARALHKTAARLSSILPIYAAVCRIVRCPQQYSLQIAAGPDRRSRNNEGWMADLAQHNVSGAHADETRRDFLILTATAIGAVGVAATIWPFIDSLNPARDTLALSTAEVDLAPVQVGQRLTVAWRGKPVFIDHRTPEEIKAAQDVNVADLRDPQPDSARVKKPEWLEIVGVCTHLGCIPLGQKVGDDRGSYGGWFCPCHGSVYDTSGRIRQGPAPQNLFVPPYDFTADTTIKIG